MYIPLHVHDKLGSIGDSILDLQSYVTQAKKKGLPAIGISNHGSIASIYEFNTLCEKAGIKAIIGAEFYVSPFSHKYLNRAVSKKDRQDEMGNIRYHAVVFVKTAKGYDNFLKLNNIGSLDYFYSKPTIPYDLFLEHGEGLVLLTGCIQGAVPQCILHKKSGKAQKILKDFQKAFDEVYLEVQPFSSPKQLKVNKALEKLSTSLSLPLIATNDIHYLNQEDAYAHNAHIIDCQKRENAYYKELILEDDCFYFMDEEDLLLPGISASAKRKAIKNTVTLSNNINFKLKTQVHMPKSKYPHAEKAFMRIVMERFNSMSEDFTNVYVYTSRLMKEIAIIKKLGFIDYFLIVYDICEYAKAQSIALGPGRGSICASLLAYVLGITKVDSLRYHLVFERFLSEYRIDSIPDIDIDIDSEKREEILQYIKDTYGESYCCLVSSTNNRKGRSAIKDAGRILKIPEKLTNEITKVIPYSYYNEDGDKEELKLEDCIQTIKEVGAYAKKHPKLFTVASWLEGIPKSSSLHAAGVVISSKKVREHLALRHSDKILQATSLDKDVIEKLAVKFDLLGSSTTAIIDKIEKEIGFSLDVTNEKNLHDEKVWDLIGSRSSCGLFQISSYLYQQRMPFINPRTIEQLAACLALIRGPCISNKLDKQYINIVQGKCEIERIHPVYDVATKDTYGILIFQEQIMRILENAGLSKEDSFLCMKALMGNKKEKIKTFYASYQKEMKKQNVPDQIARLIWDRISETSKYCFNKPHAIGYALQCYLTAYYKTYHTQVFYKHYMTFLFNHSEKKEIHRANLTRALKEAKTFGYTVLPADISCSKKHFTIINDTHLMAGSDAIKGLGKDFDLIYEYFNDITSLEDMFGYRQPTFDYDTKTEAREFNKEYKIPSKTVVVHAIFAGMFDSLYSDMDRYEIFETYMLYRKAYGYIDQEINHKKYKIANKFFNIKKDFKNIQEFLYDTNFELNKGGNLCQQ